jgi:hypothetical protein
VLLFVFRDRTRTPLPRLVETWEADLGQMWAGITKPQQYEGSSFADFFEARPAQRACRHTAAPVACASPGVRPTSSASAAAGTVGVSTTK